MNKSINNRRSHQHRYDVAYDDGDSERGVRRAFIRRVGGGDKGKSRKSSSRDDDSSAAEGDFARGDKVEARYGGKSKWYGGKVARANANGTYDITYEDGDSERGVRASLIRAK